MADSLGGLRETFYPNRYTQPTLNPRELLEQRLQIEMIRRREGIHPRQQRELMENYRNAPTLTGDDVSSSRTKA